MNFIDELKQSENLRQDLLNLRNTITDEQLRILSDNDSFFVSLISHEDSKIRKIVAEILSKTNDDKYKDLLYKAYVSEKQHMIRSSLLKAVSIYDLEEHLDELQERERVLVEALTSEIAKHAKEELRILRKILQPYRTLKKHEFIGFKTEVPIILTMPAGHQEALMDELVKYDTKKVALGVQVKTNDIDDLFECRLFGSMYFPVCKAPSLSLKDLTNKEIIKKMIRFLDRCHSGDDAYRFRLDLEEAENS